MKTLVLIDSDALTRALISECVAGRGWTVIEADNGESGMELVHAHKPMAVLCDIRTPRRNGFFVCRAIRESAALQTTRVILTSVSRFGNDRDTAMQVGAHEFLVKPVPPDDLLRALDGCVTEAAPVAELPELETMPKGPTAVRFWGVRGSIPTPGQDTALFGGNTSCVEVRVGDDVIILDAGSGIRRLGLSLMREFKDKTLNITLLVTHTHWDHIQGFPFFIPAYTPRVNVRILGYEGAVHGLRGALFEQMQSAFFPVALHQMASNVTFEELDDMQFRLANFRVKAIFSNHPGICLAYRLSTPAGDIVYMPDHEMYERHEVERQKASGETAPANLEYARRQDEKVQEFLLGADVVIADSQYDESEYPKRIGWGHTCADDTVQSAMRSGVKRLFLFHHDPDHTDAKMQAMVDRAKAQVEAAGSPMIVSAAREGEEFVLGRQGAVKAVETA